MHISFLSCYLIFNSDQKNTVNIENSRMQSIYALPEKTKRGPPSNKNIAIRNIKAHIANMSSNENAGFKCEYQVWCSFPT